VEARIQGPAVVEERESTVVMNGPATAWVDPAGNLIVRLPAADSVKSGSEAAASGPFGGKE
jgi:hypothetical protein